MLKCSKYSYATKGTFYHRHYAEFSCASVLFFPRLIYIYFPLHLDVKKEELQRTYQQRMIIVAIGLLCCSSAVMHVLLPYTLTLLLRIANQYTCILYIIPKHLHYYFQGVSMSFSIFQNLVSNASMLLSGTHFTTLYFRPYFALSVHYCSTLFFMRGIQKL